LTYTSSYDLKTSPFTSAGGDRKVGEFKLEEELLNVQLERVGVVAVEGAERDCMLAEMHCQPSTPSNLRASDM